MPAKKTTKKPAKAVKAVKAAKKPAKPTKVAKAPKSTKSVKMIAWELMVKIAKEGYAKLYAELTRQMQLKTTTPEKRKEYKATIAEWKGLQKQDMEYAQRAKPAA